MHILWVKTELLHPVDKGGRIRTYHMLRALRRQHRVTYLALDNGQAAPDAVEKASEYCHELVRIPFTEAVRRSPRFWLELLANTVSPRPYAIAKYRSSGMRAAIDRVVRTTGVDVLVCDFLTPSQNVPDGLPCRTVLFQHNVEAAIWQRHVEVRSGFARAYFAEQWRRMVRFERDECHRFDSVVAVSEADARQLESAYGLDQVGAVPTGVDIDFFRPAARAPREPLNMVFTGSMDWMPNEDGILWFVDHVLPRIHERLPGATLTVVGRNPPPRISALADRDPRLRVTGTVPDVRPYLEGASAFVVPLRVGGGTRLKIYEAMAMELPLVTTTIGAEGLPVRHGEHVLVADEAAAFANEIVGVLSDPGRAKDLGLAGATYVREHFSWDGAAEAFVGLLAAPASQEAAG